MTGESPSKDAKSSSLYQELERRMLFDPDLIREMLTFNTELLDKAKESSEVVELSASGQYLKTLLQRLEF